MYFFFNDTATTEIYTLSLHDALPICEVVAASGSLSDRKRLKEDLDGTARAEAYLTEIKAAAVDVVTRRGAEEGKPVFYCDNDPVGEGLDEELLRLAREAGAAGRSWGAGV